MFAGARIAVVVPAYNEGRLIGATVRSVPTFVDLIVIVDDASEDDTSARAREIEDPRIVICRHPENRGVGAALATGYRAAFDRDADVVAVMAGDAQMHPDDLAALVDPVARGRADYAKGDRLSHPSVSDRMPLARLIGNHALTAITRWSTGLAVSDSQCGYTALGRRAASQVDLDDLWPHYGYPNDLLSRLAVAGLKVVDVTVRPIYASEQSGIRPLHLLTVYPRVILRCASRRARASARSRVERLSPARI